MSNVNKVRAKEVPIKLEGRFRHLKYDLNAFAEMEGDFGSINEVMDRLRSGSMKAVRDIIWAGLLHEDNELTKRDVGSMIELGDLEELTPKIVEALQSALPQGEEDDNKEDEKASKSEKKVVVKNSKKAQS